MVSFKAVEVETLLCSFQRYIQARSPQGSSVPLEHSPASVSWSLFSRPSGPRPAPPTSFPAWLRHPLCPSHTGPLYAPQTCPCPLGPLLGRGPPERPHPHLRLSGWPGPSRIPPLDQMSLLRRLPPAPLSHTTPRPRGAVQVTAVSLRVPSSELALLPHRTQAPGRGQCCPSCLLCLRRARPRDWQGA